MQNNINRAIEIHDSTLSSISEKNGNIILNFDKACIHQSFGRPGVDNGTGWVQNIMFELTGFEIEIKPLKLPADLSDGYVVVNGLKHENGIEIPVNVKGEIEIELTTCNGEKVKVKAKSLKSSEIGKPKYVEEFKA